MNTVKLIVYGTLMSGERNHRFCRNAISITPCTITGTLYDTGYGFPAFVPDGDGEVKAELIEIPIEDWRLWTDSKVILGSMTDSSCKQRSLAAVKRPVGCTL